MLLLLGLMLLHKQILVLFNPSVNIHTNNNSLDWSTLSYVELMQVLWTNRAIPQGVDDIIDIASLQFQMPILVNPPAKVQKNTLIQTIINNIHAVDTGTADDFSVDDLSNVNYATYQIITLGNYKMRIVTDNADNKTAAISCTGAGEFFILGAIAYDVVARMKYGKLSLAKSVEKTVIDALTKKSGLGGIIALNRRGETSYAYNTEGMYRGTIRANGKPVSMIFDR